MDSEPYPPAPWGLRGRAIASFQLIPRERVGPLPEGLRAVCVLPGRTLAGIYLARYGVGSSLEYSELIVFSALGRSGSAFGGWVSHIYVDSAESVAGGRAIWGLPKQLAEFDWSDGVLVTSGGREIVRLAEWRAGLRLPMIAPLPAFGIRDGRLLHFKAICRGMVGPTRARFLVPAESPFHHLGLGGGWSFDVSGLHARIPAAVELTRTGAT